MIDSGIDMSRWIPQTERTLRVMATKKLWLLKQLVELELFERSKEGGK